MCGRVEVGDEIRLNGGDIDRILSMDPIRRLYFTAGGRILCRYDFKPTKWDGDTSGNTGIGVCAKNGSEQ